MADIVFDDDGTLVALVVDATPEEIHRATALATEQAVERGVAITDHVRPERRTLTLSIVISDTPIRSTTALGGSEQTVELELPARSAYEKGPQRVGPAKFEAAELEERAAPTMSVQIFQPDAEPTRIADSWALLLDARDRALLATVTTRLETYENMVLIEAHATRTAQDGSWLRAELTFAEIHQVSTELVDDPVPARARDRRPENRGSQSTEDAPPRLRSLAVQGLEGIASLFGGG